MEKEITINTPDKKKIYAKFRGNIKKPTVVLVHGLSSSMIEALHVNAAKFFEKNGFSVMRFNLYDWRKDARSMNDCTLKIHGEDIDTVVSHLRKKGVKKVFVIGHSYGAPSILHSKKQNFNGVVFWDGSYGINKYFNVLKYVKELDGRIMNAGYDIFLPEKMVTEANNVDQLALLKKLHAPLKIICAGKCKLISGGKTMLKNANLPKDFAIIKGATHNFEEVGAEELLYKETLKWIKKYV